MDKIIEKIPKLTDEELLQLFRNAVNAQVKEKHARAGTVIAAVEKEWAVRLLRYRKRQYVAQRPSAGMLSELGYKVGFGGAPGPARRRILEFAVEGNLPMVGSPAYTEEWGPPSSAKRYHKLVRTIRSFLDNPRLQRTKNIEKAMIDWQEDLEFIQDRFGMSFYSSPG